MIYLITGVPGSGKTLYAVSTLVQKLAAEKIVNKEGIEQTRRVVVDGIKRRLTNWMAESKEDDKGNFTCEGDGLLTWSSWCQPGDVLVIDEIQRYWRPRGMGVKPPVMIKDLETHRHKGVDFVIVTQNPMLIDQNVRRLVGRHCQHIRRILGMQRAIIYDWDGCSVDINRTKTATTSFFNYPKSAYALYKSSELHTKQRQKVPPWLIVPVLAIVGGVALAPTAIATMKNSVTGKGVTAAPSSAASAPRTGAVGQSGGDASQSRCRRTRQLQIQCFSRLRQQSLNLRGVCQSVKMRCTDDVGKLVLKAMICRSHIAGMSDPGSKVVTLEVQEVSKPARLYYDTGNNFWRGSPCLRRRSRVHRAIRIAVKKYQCCKKHKIRNCCYL